MFMPAIPPGRANGARGFWVLLAGLLIATTVVAQVPEESPIDWFNLLMGLFGGLALFLFGIDQLSGGLKAVAGMRMSDLLGRFTRNRFTGAITGAVVTAILNSSSVTTVLVVGFITAGIMTLQQSLGVIMGANIGSTMTAQIVAFNITQYALLPVAIGFACMALGKTDQLQKSGLVIFGLGLLFGGMGIMSEAMYPLRTYEPFIDLMASLESPLLGIIVGAAFTGLVQSSAATTGIAIVMASEGLLTLPAGIALALGANIGTCVTALLAAFGKPVAARRAAAAHILFNIIGVLIWIPLIDLLAQLVVAISPAYPELVGRARVAEETPRQIANAHTLFNVANTVVFIWFTGPLARLVERVVPEKAEVSKAIIEPKFLDEALLDTPSLALNAARLELQHLGNLATKMVRQIGPAIKGGRMADIDALEQLDDQVDVLHARIIDYLNDVHKRELTDEETVTFLRIMRGADEVERMGDVVESDLVPVARTILSEQRTTTETMRHTLRTLYERVCVSAETAIYAIGSQDASKANDVLNMKAEINALIEDALRFQAQVVSPTAPDLVDSFRLEDEIIDGLKRIYSLSKRLAKGLLPAEILAKEA
jgi:phosphate:Na+ symporter